jgi:hypothetical protein
MVPVHFRCYVIRTAAYGESYLGLTPDDVTEAFRRVTGQQFVGRFAEDGVLFDLDWGSCVVTGTSGELRLRYDGASTGHLADGFTERLVATLEEITGEPYGWARQVAGG